MVGTENHQVEECQVVAPLLEPDLDAPVGFERVGPEPLRHQRERVDVARTDCCEVPVVQSCYLRRSEPLG